MSESYPDVDFSDRFDSVVTFEIDWGVIAPTLVVKLAFINFMKRTGSRTFQARTFGQRCHYRKWSRKQTKMAVRNCPPSIQIGNDRLSM